MTHDRIVSERLELRPMSADFMQALFDARTDDAATLESVVLPAEWDVVGPHGWLASRIRRVRAVPGLAAWGLRTIIRRADQQVLGNIGFHEPPGMHPADGELPGVVESGFTVAAVFRRTGIASEAQRALMDWANREHGVRHFRLSIALTNVPSQRLAESLGFTQLGSYEHPARGTEYLYQFSFGD